MRLKLLLSLAGAIVAVALLLASAAMNYHFGQSFGRTSYEAAIYGSVSVLAVFCNGLCPFFLSWFWEGRRYASALAAGLLWVLCLIYSFSSALGFAAENRSNLIGARLALQADYEAALGQLADLEKTRSQYRRPPQRLDDRIDQLREEIADLRKKGALGETDPQSDLISRKMFGLLEKNEVRLKLIALLPLWLKWAQRSACL
jgi:cell division protein FtsB